MNERQIGVIGGGAAGFFGAIACAEANPSCTVTLYEATAHPLAKVKVSGGGRCNVTHACFEPRELARRYPRGARELTGAFSRFQPRDTVAWFEARGVSLKAESDGRMFPVTNDSQTIVDCLMGAAREAGVRLRTPCGVKQVEIEPVGVRQVERVDPNALSSAPNEVERVDLNPLTTGKTNALGSTRSTFRLTLTTNEVVTVDRVLLATGGNKSNTGFELARQFGHTIEPPVPSLFTFHITDPRLKDLSGVSVEEAATAVVGTPLQERGPMLVTHWGLSGPAVLKLSAWGARLLAERDYRFTLRVNWVPRFNVETARAALERARAAEPRKQVTTWCPLGVPLRLWERLVIAAGLSPTTPWTAVPNAALRSLAAQVTEAEFAVGGKSLFKEEFVTCGGVRLAEVDFKTMESRLVPGLYFAGEMLDLDGITGGFNFQAAWTTGWHAGRAMAG
ncbi:MAG: NAD(P)/FAD-dependent oxidoreductase [Candidatus Didemnitutus sp.]|nr:NAD(P)/FAD-dependent oxidoreductase [Candidatus Didemnitutus sp.]